MTRTSTATLAVAADYADAMMTARRAKNWLFMLILVVLLSQITVFFLARFNVLKLGDAPAGSTLVSGATTAPTTAAVEGTATQPATAPVTAERKPPYPFAEFLRYIIPIQNYLGLTLMVALAVVLLLITLIMLVGRLIGVSHVTGAFIWAVLLIVLLFPWQTFLLTGPRDASPDSPVVADDPSFKIPGVLYTWPELAKDYDFNAESEGSTGGVILKWTRFAGMPIASLLLLLLVQAKSSRGLKFALGESEMHVEVTSQGL